MKAWLKTISALAAAAVAVVLFRALFFAMYTVSGTRLEPVLMAGDRVLVNRWSYGLRTGGMNGLFGYGRICADSVRVGDIVAFDSPAGGPGGVLVCRCAALPGDTVATPVPGLQALAHAGRATMTPRRSPAGRARPALTGSPQMPHGCPCTPIPSIPANILRRICKHCCHLHISAPCSGTRSCAAMSAFSWSDTTLTASRHTATGA